MLRPTEPRDLPSGPAAAAAGPIAGLQRRREEQGLHPDAAQDRAAQVLQRLHEALLDCEQAPAARPPRLLRLFHGRPISPPPRGVYLHGAVGRGKTMLMDLFCAAAPVARKRRVHFGAFMLEMHDRLHRMRRSGSAEDAVPALGRALAKEVRLLCLDELQIDNIADAMLVSRLFEAILDAGTVVVATSNWAPESLYAGGLHRERVLPFIALIEERLDVVFLDGGVDYRRAKLKDMQAWHWPLNLETEQALERDFAALTEGLPSAPVDIEVQGRVLHVPRAAKGVAWLTFQALCGAPRGTADYLALAQRFDVVVLAGIPLLRPERREEARRFTLLLDVLYERGTKLLCSAAAPPDRLFDIPRDAVVTARALSRLLEMQSAAYLSGIREENEQESRRSLALAVERE